MSVLREKSICPFEPLKSEPKYPFNLKVLFTSKNQNRIEHLLQRNVSLAMLSERKPTQFTLSSIPFLLTISKRTFCNKFSRNKKMKQSKSKINETRDRAEKQNRTIER